MKITLNAAEVAHACERYVKRANISDDGNHEYVAVVAWRGQYAEVTVTRKLPLLTDAVAVEVAQ